jgi:two-component system sensor histidine kinase KdpD
VSERPIEPAGAGATAGAGAGARADEFLRLIQRGRRGRLKIYIGAAAGVGKTYVMLREGNRLKAEGVDVVVGFVETHGRAETAAQVEKLEVVPRRRIVYRGLAVEEMDLERLLERRPAVALVDELAHTNVPGSRHAKRYEDIEALIDAGIHVISTMNIQHLESLHDHVQRMVGVGVKERVPDRMVEQADQLVMVDLPPEDLRSRLAAGKIYVGDKVEQALKSFFTLENLASLRELALREVAFDVGRKRRELYEPGEVPAQPETVMVCMSSLPRDCEALLRKGARLAGRFAADWYVVYVATPKEEPTRIDSATQRALIANLELAERLGATVVKLQGSEVVGTLIRFACEHGVSHIIVGRSQRSRLYELLHGSVIDRLIRAAGGIDVHVVNVGGAVRERA